MPAPVFWWLARGSGGSCHTPRKRQAADVLNKGALASWFIAVAQWLRSTAAHAKVSWFGASTTEDERKRVDAPPLASFSDDDQPSALARMQCWKRARVSFSAR
jgi:hypothetical protein